MTAEKLRGGFYTPQRLVRSCLDTVAQLIGDREALRVLEPSAGDGAFLRGLAAHPTLSGRVEAIRALEIVPEEAAKASLSLNSTGLNGSVSVTSAIGWAGGTEEAFDVAVGNPPFVRYQYIDRDERPGISCLGERLGLQLSGVGNLWIPIFMGALSRLRSGGVFAFVIPTECFSGCSAGVVREWLGRQIDDLRVDLFPPGSFPTVLQEVTVVSGRRRTEPADTASKLTIAQRTYGGQVREWTHAHQADERSWTRYLLTPRHLEAVAHAADLPTVRALGDVASLEVSIVTGANSYFCVDDRTLNQYQLVPWARPLLPRVRHARGLIYTTRDQDALRSSGARCWLLDFSPDRPDPASSSAAADYLAVGVENELPRRYKCRIREPWFRVPSIRAGRLLLSKRSHLHPRLLLNEAGAMTTDTVYRGSVVSELISEADLVSTFHSSLTLLAAEMEGRSFGGGVLELVPSELARLLVPAVPGLGRHVHQLDEMARTSQPEALVARTDQLLRDHAVLPADLLEELSEARGVLLARRLDRNRRPSPESVRLAA